MTPRPAATLVALALLLPGCARPPAPAIPAPSTTEPWSMGSAAGTLTRTTHYRFFTTTEDAMLAAALPAFLERCLDRYITELAQLPPPTLRLDTFVLRDRAQWEDLTRRVLGDAAGPYLGIERGGFAAGGRALFWNVGLRDTLALAAHEGWHQYAQRALRDELPLWLDEAVATWFEGLSIDPAAPDGEVIRFTPRANPERLSELRRARAAGRLVPLRTLLETAPTEALADDADRALAWYAQAWALAVFLRDRHPDALAAALSDAAQGRLVRTVESRAGRDHADALRARRAGPGVLLAYVTTDLASLERDYAAFLASLSAPG